MAPTGRKAIALANIKIGIIMCDYQLSIARPRTKKPVSF
jgi:hypothetical protein